MFLPSIVYFPSFLWSYYILKINGDPTVGSHPTRKSMACLLGKWRERYVMKGTQKKINRCIMRAAPWLNSCWQGTDHISPTLHIPPSSDFYHDTEMRIFFNFWDHQFYRVLCMHGVKTVNHADLEQINLNH